MFYKVMLSLSITGSIVMVVAGAPPSASTARHSHGWTDQRQVGPIVYHADFPLQPALESLSAVVKLQDDLARQLLVPPAAEDIHAYLFAKKETLHRYVNHYLPGVPLRPALYVKHEGPGMLFAVQGSQFQTDLHHEATHAFLHASLPLVPLWLDEGLAEYFEVPADQREAGHPHLKSIRWQARLRRVPRLADLERLADLSQMKPCHYRDAWAWVHFMLHGPAPARTELQRYLSDIHQHTDPGRLSQRLPQVVPDLHRQYLQHFRR